MLAKLRGPLPTADSPVYTRFRDSEAKNGRQENRPSRPLENVQNGDSAGAIFLPVRISLRIAVLSCGNLREVMPRGRHFPPLGMPRGRDFSPLGMPRGRDFFPLGMPRGRDFFPLGMPRGRDLFPLGMPRGPDFSPLGMPRGRDFSEGQPALTGDISSERISAGRR